MKMMNENEDVDDEVCGCEEDAMRPIREVAGMALCP